MTVKEVQGGERKEWFSLAMDIPAKVVKVITYTKAIKDIEFNVACGRWNLIEKRGISTNSAELADYALQKALDDKKFGADSRRVSVVESMAVLCKIPEVKQKARSSLRLVPLPELTKRAEANLREGNYEKLIVYAPLSDYYAGFVVNKLWNSPHNAGHPRWKLVQLIRFEEKHHDGFMNAIKERFGRATAEDIEELFVAGQRFDPERFAELMAYVVPHLKSYVAAERALELLEKHGVEVSAVRKELEARREGH